MTSNAMFRRRFWGASNDCCGAKRRASHSRPMQKIAMNAIQDAESRMTIQGLMYDWQQQRSSGTNPPVYLLTSAKRVLQIALKISAVEALGRTFPNTNGNPTS